MLSCPRARIDCGNRSGLCLRRTHRFLPPSLRLVKRRREQRCPLLPVADYIWMRCGTLSLCVEREGKKKALLNISDHTCRQASTTTAQAKCALPRRAAPVRKLWPDLCFRCCVGRSCNRIKKHQQQQLPAMQTRERRRSSTINNKSKSDRPWTKTRRLVTLLTIMARVQCLYAQRVSV